MTAAVGPPRGRAAARSGGAPADGELSHRQILTILGALMLGMLLAALDQTIVASSIRVIADSLNGLSMLAWATTAYLITATISTPLYGKLSDLHGRKPYFMLGISIFIAGSILAGTATSMYELAAFRAIQGLGAGGLMSLALAILGDIVPPRQRAKYQGYFLAVFGTSSVIGPLVGGFFADQPEILGIEGWRWVFYINVPIAAIALVVVFRVLNIAHVRRDHRIDWPGAAALAVSLVPLLIVAQQGHEWGWSSAQALVCYAIGVVGLVAFLIAEHRCGADALVPLRLFRNGVFSVSLAVGLLVGMGMFGAIALLPQYMQIVRGATPTQSGLLLLPLMAGIMTGNISSGQLTALTGRYKIFPVIGTAVMVVGLLLLSRVGVDTPFWVTSLYMAVFGYGLGNCMQTLTLAVQNAVPARDMGVATAAATFFRQLGGTLGTAVFLSVLFSTVGTKIADAFRDIVPTPGFQAVLSDPAVRAAPGNQKMLHILGSGGGTSGNAGGVLQDSSFIQQLDPRLARPFLVGFSSSMDLVFIVAAAVVLVAFVLIWFMREVPLRTVSGLQAAAAERAAAEGTAAPAGALPGRLESVVVPAVALGALARYLERVDGDAPALTAAAARLAPDGGDTDHERARSAARTVLRPIAADALRSVLNGTGGPPSSADRREER